VSLCVYDPSALVLSSPPLLKRGVTSDDTPRVSTGPCEAILKSARK
jgi:hypothetical protein